MCDNFIEGQKLGFPYLSNSCQIFFRNPFLADCRVSSNVNEVINIILSQRIFFLQKDIARTKTLTSKNELTKQKETNIKQQRQQFFERTNC